MKILQNRTVSMISTLFQNVRVRTSLYFNEKGASLKKGWEPMTYGDNIAS